MIKAVIYCVVCLEFSPQEFADVLNFLDVSYFFFFNVLLEWWPYQSSYSDLTRPQWSLKQLYIRDWNLVTSLSMFAISYVESMADLKQLSAKSHPWIDLDSLTPYFIRPLGKCSNLILLSSSISYIYKLTEKKVINIRNRSIIAPSVMCI